jgi:hypothetical protein
LISDPALNTVQAISLQQSAVSSGPNSELRTHH